MPEGTKVARCVSDLMTNPKHKKGAGSKTRKESAIRICQASTGQSYQTGKPSKTNPKTKKGKEWYRQQYKKKKK